MPNITEKEWRKQVHAALQMPRAFTRDEQRYHLSKWYEIGFDVETIKLAYSYDCKKTNSSKGSLMDRPSGWNFLDRILGWINIHGAPALQWNIDNLEV